MSWARRTFGRLVPTYGNWGGPGWAGATRDGPNWYVSPVDSLDAKFMLHDFDYARGSCKEDYQQADRNLLVSLGSLNPDPREWKNPPSSIVYARLYRYGALVAFHIVLGFRAVLKFFTGCGDCH